MSAQSIPLKFDEADLKAMQKLGVTVEDVAKNMSDDDYKVHVSELKKLARRVM